MATSFAGLASSITEYDLQKRQSLLILRIAHGAQGAKSRDRGRSIGRSSGTFSSNKLKDDARSDISPDVLIWAASSFRRPERTPERSISCIRNVMTCDHHHRGRHANFLQQLGQGTARRP
jgi:hypothetical protein